VTNTQYLAFVQATGHRRPAHWQDGKPLPGQEEHPVVNVSWYDALAYCRWLAEVTGRPYRLPSEAEWEKGARGDGGRIYPWGDGWDAARCNARREPGDYSGAPSEEGVTSVLAYPAGASPYGALDMAGNVWEWTLSLWGEGGHEPTFKYPYDLADGRENVEAPTDVRRVLRGGSFNYGLASARCACRNRVAPESMNWYVGFRVMFPVK
jgi:formylglycine-generating enzyme required for sulfatase activity